ncbi:MAG TPA: hypothetical protein VFY93_02540 [Planctomycetota bacterium]|nr:hypothetical protein [Planctomycetota bacterium]
MRVTRGTGYLYFAYDVGQGIDLDAASRLLTVPAEPAIVRHRRPAPRYFQYEEPPLRIRLPVPALPVGGRATREGAEAVLFDFGAVSVRYTVPLEGPFDGLIPLSAAMEEGTGPLAEDARRRVGELVETLRAAITDPHVAPLVEDYVVYGIAALDPPTLPAELLGVHAGQLARILRGERSDLSADEVQDAISARISYGLADLTLLDWNAALVFDEEAEDACAVLEYANTQLLEMRLLDGKLDRSLDRCYEAVSARGFELPFVPLDVRRIGRMQVDGALLYERVRNALKLLGDQYLSRLYRLAAGRFHLAEWHGSIQRKLDALESVYGKLFDRASTRRMEFLEWLIVALIVVEVVLSLAH